jgi:hypothetical protein
MNRNVAIRLAKLEARAPAPRSPFDGMTLDELSVLMLEQYTELLARDGVPGQSESAHGLNLAAASAYSEDVRASAHFRGAER